MPLNGRENLLKVFNHEMPEYLPRMQDTAFMMFPFDWSSSMEPEFDAWGVRWIPVPLSGQMVDEKTPPVIKEMSHWRDYLKVPDPYELCDDWEAMGKARSAHWNRETQMGALVMLEGHFERMHSLYGFENSLMSLYDEDDEGAVRDLFTEITNYKIKCLEIAKKYFDPDIIVYHDDWGHSRNMFFAPEVWRSMIKPYFKIVVEKCHELGMKFELHSCGHIQEVVEECAEIGIDSIQTLMYPQNDIRYVKKVIGDKVVIRGGYDGQNILRPDVSDEAKRATILDSLSVLAPGGNHIPYYYSFGKDPEHSLKVFADTVAEYEAKYGPC